MALPHPTTICFCPTSRALQLPSSRRCHATPWPPLRCACRHSPCQHQACGHQKQQVPHPDVLLPGACSGPEPAAGHHVWLISHHPSVGCHDTLRDGSTAGSTDVAGAAGPAWQACAVARQEDTATVLQQARASTCTLSTLTGSQDHGVLLVQGHCMQHHHHCVLCSPSQQRTQGLTMVKWGRPTVGKQLSPLPHAELWIP